MYIYSLFMSLEVTWSIVVIEICLLFLPVFWKKNRKTRHNNSRRKKTKKQKVQSRTKPPGNNWPMSLSPKQSKKQNHNTSPMTNEEEKQNTNEEEKQNMRSKQEKQNMRSKQQKQSIPPSLPVVPPVPLWIDKPVVSPDAPQPRFQLPQRRSSGAFTEGLGVATGLGFVSTALFASFITEMLSAPPSHYDTIPPITFPNVNAVQFPRLPPRLNTTEKIVVGMLGQLHASGIPVYDMLETFFKTDPSIVRSFVRRDISQDLNVHTELVPYESTERAWQEHWGRFTRGEERRRQREFRQARNNFETMNLRRTDARNIAESVQIEPESQEPLENDLLGMDSPHIADLGATDPDNEE